MSISPGLIIGLVVFAALIAWGYFSIPPESEDIKAARKAYGKAGEPEKSTVKDPEPEIIPSEL